MKYDWIKMEREFTMHTKYAVTSLREYAKIKGITYGDHYKTKTKGWLEKRAQYQSQKSTKIQDALQTKQVSQEVSVNNRHYTVWDKILALVQKDLEGANQAGDVPLTAFAKIVEKAQKGQRLALGMDREDNTGAERRMESIFDIMAEAYGRVKTNGT